MFVAVQEAQQQCEMNVITQGTWFEIEDRWMETLNQQYTEMNL